MKVYVIGPGHVIAIDDHLGFYKEVIFGKDAKGRDIHLLAWEEDGRRDYRYFHADGTDLTANEEVELGSLALAHQIRWGVGFIE